MTKRRIGLASWNYREEFAAGAAYASGPSPVPQIGTMISEMTSLNMNAKITISIQARNRSDF